MTDWKEMSELATGMVGVRVKKVKDKWVPDEPENELDNFYTCGICGQSVDRRDLGQVFYHEDADHEPIPFDA